jgi:hypothetical protein
MGDPRYPIVDLLAFVDDEFDDSLVSRLSDLVADLGSSRSWTIGPPRVVDQADSSGIRTVGLVQQIYAAFDDGENLLDEATDRAQLAEVRIIVAAVESLSADTGLDFGLELDGGSVGWVEGGSATDDLRVGLIESWAQRFA